MIVTIDIMDIIAGGCVVLFFAFFLCLFFLDKIGCAIRARQQKRIDRAYEEDTEE